MVVLYTMLLTTIKIVIPFTQVDSDDSTIDWIVLVKSYNFRGQWDKKDPKQNLSMVTVGTDTITAKETEIFTQWCRKRSNYFIHRKSLYI